MTALDDCTLQTCPIQTSYYGYRPNLGIDVFLVAVYGLDLLFLAAVLIWKRRRGWLAYTITLGVGSALELMGFVLRSLAHSNPWNLNGFILQYTFLTIAPVFMCASIYFSIGELARRLGKGYFSINPVIYPRVFIVSDTVALVIQATGGALSANTTNPNGLPPGVKVTIVGLSFQLVSLVVFSVLFTAVVLPSRMFQGGYTPVEAPKQEGATLSRKEADRGGRRTRGFAVGIAVATFLILLRSAYRVAELSHGLHGGLAANEWAFIGVDGLPIVIATTILATLHPALTLDWYKEKAVKGRSDEVPTA